MNVLPELIDIRAERARRRLYKFVRLMWPVLEPGTPFVDGIHIRLICEALERVTRGELRRLIINIPPRYGKSNIVSVLWPVWVWLNHPERDFLTASYGQQLAEDHSGAARRLIESPPFQRWFGDRFALSPDVNQRGRYDNDRGGTRIATSIGGVATGHGGDYLILDDPMKADEAHSKAARENVIATFDYSFATRLNNPHTGAIVIVCQRLHERDLVGHLLARGGWTHLCLAAEFDPKHPYRYEHDPRTTDGELLWPAQYGAEELTKLKQDLGPYGAASQLQQLPSPEGGHIFPRDAWQWYDPAQLSWMRFDEVLVSVDLAYGGEDHNDYCVCHVWGAREGNCYLLHIIRARRNFTGQVEMVREARDWAIANVNYPYTPAVYIEDAANARAVIDVLKKEIRRIRRVAAVGDKVARAHAVSGLVVGGRVFLPGRANADGTGYDRALTPDTSKQLVDECSAFPKAAYDDGVDALTLGLAILDRPRLQLRSFG